jgi:hypothetical protein
MVGEIWRVKVNYQLAGANRLLGSGADSPSEHVDAAARAAE